jgi:tetratricopeptide (TPR) repeat protein
MEDRGEHDQAVEYLSESVRLAPWWPASRSHLALALAGQGRFGEAIELGKDAALRAPDHTETRNNLALIYYRAGHLNAALSEGLVAIQCDPMSPSAHHTVGLISGSGCSRQGSHPSKASNEPRPGDS